jgi:hypothetical protein
VDIKQSKKMKTFILNVIHEDELSPLSLEGIKGGTDPGCNIYCKKANGCICNASQDSNLEVDPD